MMKETPQTKLRAAYSALRLANGDVTAAKAYTAGLRIRISARTWAKAIDAYRLVH